MLIDELLPHYQVKHHHDHRVDAPPPAVYEAMQGTDLARDPIVNALFRIRGFGKRPPEASVRTLAPGMFTKLAERPGEEIVLGLVGRFWLPTAGLRAIEPEEFASFDEPGYGKAVWNFAVRPEDGGSLLSTETRVLCTDTLSLAAFRLYWIVVGPFSELIRQRALALIAKEAAS